MPARPVRVKIKNELGLFTSLSCSGGDFELRGSGPDLVVWGLGPQVQTCAGLCPPARQVFWIESPDFAAQMAPAWHNDIPGHWIRITPDQLPEFSSTARHLLYRPNVRLFPSFWQPLLARLLLQHAAPRTKAIWLPGPASALITPELADAATQLGHTARFLPARPSIEELKELLAKERPALFISINFHGLDPYGANQTLLEAAGVPILVWCVDNPFHVLTQQKTTLWKKLVLAVTDAWFIPALTTLGARPMHLPLATSLKFFPPGPVCPNGNDLLFVGRSSFPHRKAFFAATTLPQTLLDQARRLPGREAHFAWWHKQLGAPLWPDQRVRASGLGAEILSQSWRAQTLGHLAQNTELTIIGDAAWADLVPGARLHKPLDYYHGLAQTYAKASFCLNLTSLLLPHGLTQRHFDVWACGGFLLTDHTPGLDIFPSELTRPVCFKTAHEASDRLRDLAAAPQHKESLRQSWQALVLGQHSYKHRLQQILATFQIK